MLKKTSSSFEKRDTPESGNERRFTKYDSRIRERRMGKGASHC